MRAYRFALRPAWLLLHVVCAVLVVVMIELGRWQLTVSEQKHFSVRNFGYAIQWWLFTGFVVIMWARALRDHARGRSGQETDRMDAELRSLAPVTYRRYVAPSIPAESDDPQVSAYNEYLARLAARDARERPA